MTCKYRRAESIKYKYSAGYDYVSVHAFKTIYINEKLECFLLNFARVARNRFCRPTFLLLKNIRMMDMATATGNVEFIAIFNKLTSNNFTLKVQ